MAVAWTAQDLLRVPEIGPYRGTDDVEGLMAIYGVTGMYPLDLSNTLNWPWASERWQDYSAAVTPVTVSAAMNQVATDLWTAHPGGLCVLVSGDVASVGVLSALINQASDTSLIEVRYTQSGYDLYPDLFDTILPPYNVTLTDRTGQSLTDGLTVPFVDGRSCDDCMGNYPGIIEAMRYEIENLTLTDFIDFLASRVPSDLQTNAVNGITLLSQAAPFSITTPWELMLWILRSCCTQFNVGLAGISEADPAAALANREPFYDAPYMTKATADLAAAGIHAEGDELLDLRNYIAGVLGNTTWASNPPVSSTSYIYGVSRFNSHWLDETNAPQLHTAFPVLSLDGATDYYA